MSAISKNRVARAPPPPGNPGARGARVIVPANPLIIIPRQAGGRGRPPYVIASYLNPQKFLENKSCSHRQDEEQPNPVHTIARDFDIAIRIINRNGFDRTILRQRRLCRREHTLPEVPTQADRRNSRQLAANANRLLNALAAVGNLHSIFSFT